MTQIILHEGILNVMSNLEKKPIAHMKDSLQELIEQVETSVCVPEFCVNDNIHSSYQNLTKKTCMDNFKKCKHYQLTNVIRQPTF